jgi:threonine/homoserine/homoserine lactone efflux protein
MANLFVVGLVVGFLLSAPVGPIAVLCVQRTMNHGKAAGFVSGLGAAAADAIYGTLAAFGVTIISAFLMNNRMAFQRIGGAVLIVMGARLLFAKPAEKRNANNDRGLWGDFFSTLVLTLTNPMTFIAFAVIFATLGVGVVRGHTVLTVELVLGVFLGAGVWWTAVVALVNLFRDRFRYRTLVIINRVTGVFVMSVGVFYLAVLKPKAEAPRILTGPIEAIERHRRTPTQLPATVTP